MSLQVKQDYTTVEEAYSGLRKQGEGYRNKAEEYRKTGRFQSFADNMPRNDW